MVLFLNGAFGVGKTTVARLLRRAMPGSAIYDPEPAGSVLRQLARWAPLCGRGTGDYQDMPAWRACTVAGVRATRLTRGVVIVPMAFTDRAHLTEIRDAVRRVDADVRHYCLLAPLHVVRGRLARRGVDGATSDGAWVLRRAAECCAVHARPEFGVHVHADQRTADEVAREIVGRLSGAV